MDKPGRSIPVPGMDRKVWESDYVQFPRLLSMIASGEGDKLKADEVEAILKRAQKKWQRILDSYKPRGKRGKQKEAQFS